MSTCDILWLLAVSLVAENVPRFIVPLADTIRFKLINSAVVFIIFCRL